MLLERIAHWDDVLVTHVLALALATLNPKPLPAFHTFHNFQKITTKKFPKNFQKISKKFPKISKNFPKFQKTAKDNKRLQPWRGLDMCGCRKENVREVLVSKSDHRKTRIMHNCLMKSTKALSRRCMTSSSLSSSTRCARLGYVTHTGSRYSRGMCA